MSTTFAIFHPDDEKYVKMQDGEIINYLQLEEENIARLIAVRGNGGWMDWYDGCASVFQSFLADDVKIYPVDNSAQGVFTIGDVRKEMNPE